MLSCQDFYDLSGNTIRAFAYGDNRLHEVTNVGALSIPYTDDGMPESVQTDVCD